MPIEIEVYRLQHDGAVHATPLSGFFVELISQEIGNDATKRLTPDGLFITQKDGQLVGMKDGEVAEVFKENETWVVYDSRAPDDRGPLKPRKVVRFVLKNED